MNLDSAIINGKLHVTCDLCPTLVPYDGPYLCASCRADEWAASLADPEQWHPEGPLYVHHGRARFELEVTP